MHRNLLLPISALPIHNSELVTTKSTKDKRNCAPAIEDVPCIEESEEEQDVSLPNVWTMPDVVIPPDDSVNTQDDFAHDVDSEGSVVIEDSQDDDSVQPEIQEDEIIPNQPEQEPQIPRRSTRIRRPPQRYGQDGVVMRQTTTLQEPDWFNRVSCLRQIVASGELSTMPENCSKAMLDILVGPK